MILKETILSAFTDRGTLLKWLKKVETALNDSTLTDISINQISETQVKMKFTFANGDFVESPVLTLPRGEKGEPGNAGMDGVAATITIGSVTTGAPGTSAVVQNVGTEQDAILQFVIPRGAKGDSGAGFDNAASAVINDGITGITEDATVGMTVAGKLKITAGGETFEIPSQFKLPIKGSGSVVLDVNETGNFFTIHLDATASNKLAKALVLPSDSSANSRLVGVSSANAQEMLAIGNGLKVASNALVTTIKFYLEGTTLNIVEEV